MKRLENNILAILKGFGWVILGIVLCAALVILLPIIGAILIVVGPVSKVNSLKREYRTKQFLKKHQGKMILFCTDGKFYYSFVGRNRTLLEAMVDKIIYMDPYVNPDYKLVNWASMVNLHGGFPILLKVGNTLESRNLKNDFFRNGRGQADDYYIEVLNSCINELKFNKTVL